MKTYWKAYLWTVIILYLSLSPKENFPKVGILNFDKFVHLLMYSVLTILYVFAFHKNYGKNKTKYLLYPVVIGMIMGSATELAQGMEIIGRNSDWLDMVANSLGVILAILLFKPIQNLSIKFNLEKFL